MRKLAGRASRMAADLCYWFNLRYGVFEDDWPECRGKEAYQRLTDAALKADKSEVCAETKFNALRDAIRRAEAEMEMYRSKAGADI